MIDGYLVDYEPPVQIYTELSTQGMTWRVGEQVKVYDTGRQQIELFKAPDGSGSRSRTSTARSSPGPSTKSSVTIWPRKLDPASRRKTLIYCVSDSHADLVVDLLKHAFNKQYGSVDDDAVIKITGAADKPLQLIRRYKNERQPNVAVYRGPADHRRRRPRDLQPGLPASGEQPHPVRPDARACHPPVRLRRAEDKESFRVFDAVRIFEALGNMTAMQPVVVNPKIGFAQLAQELATLKDAAAAALARDQFLAKLQRKKRHLSAQDCQAFEAMAGMAPQDLIVKLKALPLADVTNWFIRHPGLGELLDRQSGGTPRTMYVSDHPDRFERTERGYGKAHKPEDYLREFGDYLKSHGNEIPALLTVLTRPRDLTRAQLRELVLALDTAGFTETRLATAWRELTNQDIAARIVGYIRQAAIGDPLLPYSERVDRALQHLLVHPPGGMPWSTPQRDWLKGIAAQTRANVLVDCAALDDPDLIFKREGGGFNRLDKIQRPAPARAGRIQ